MRFGVSHNDSNEIAAGLDAVALEKQRGLLTVEDGDAYFDFLRRWGETPGGKKLLSCVNCGHVVCHHEDCDIALRQPERKADHGFVVVP